MATKQQAPKEKPATMPAKEKQPQSPGRQNAALPPFVFNKDNYIIMVAGLAIILIGFLLMGGGATKDPNIFPKDEIYSFRRLTVAPIVIIIGFGIEIFAIFKRPKIQ